ELGSCISACVGIAPGFRWTPAPNLHLTIRFIGSVEREVVDDVAGRLGELDLRGFEIELGDIGVFKRGRRVRVVWIGLKAGGDEAVALAAHVEAECRRAGLAPPVGGGVPPRGFPSGVAAFPPPPAAGSGAGPRRRGAAAAPAIPGVAA